jgi:Uma2 family endonuclease
MGEGVGQQKGGARYIVGVSPRCRVTCSVRFAREAIRSGMPEQRIRTQRGPAHYRVPDLCLTQAKPPEDVFTEPPFLCVEILSPGDAAVEVLAKIREYLAFGVAYVWIVDPETGTGEIQAQLGEL